MREVKSPSLSEANHSLDLIFKPFDPLFWPGYSPGKGGRGHSSSGKTGRKPGRGKGKKKSFFVCLRVKLLLEVETLLKNDSGGILFCFLSRVRRCIIRVKVKDGGYEAEVSHWQLEGNLG